jgi:pimeloyl-ACP methyl ester carboxylesterase
VGHDWGGFVAWAMPLLFPERTAGVVGVNTPYIAFPATQMLRAISGGKDESIYILWFQAPGVAEEVLDANPRLVFEKLMRGGVPLEEALRRAAASGGPLDMNPFRRLAELEPLGHEILAPAELRRFVESFERTGFRGGINWYRNIDRNRALLPQAGEAPLSVPCLMVTAEWDPALRPEMAAGMPAKIADLETVMIAKCGHWTQQEKPEELNRILVSWLRRRFAGS